MHLELSENLNEDMGKTSIPATAPGINVSSYSPGGSSSTTPTTSNRDPESFPSTPGDTPPPSPKDKMSNMFFSLLVEKSQYKILHFHFGGLDKLAKVFEDYNFLSKSNNKMNGSCPYRQFSVCRSEISAAECHPEEGIYTTIDEQRWRSFMSFDGTIEDELQLRKEIFFGGLDVKLHKEVWPFLLHYYSFHSTFDEREQIRNDKYIEYQNIRRKRDQMSPSEVEVFWRNIQCTVEKDVVRTDRTHPFFAGEDNPNIEIMKNILLNYGFYNPKIGYTQGMSDLLAPILAAVQDESEAFWCFVGLMQRTIFVTCPKDFDMDVNLNYLRELFRVMNVKFYHHLVAAEALDLLFVHRWILLCFKREFPEADAMRMWEACWAHYQTDYFHLFICSAIVSIYSDDVISQSLRADEMMVYFSSLALHMNGDVVLRKARGLLHQFRLLPRIPCTLSRLCELCGPGMWDSGHVPVIDCSGNHGDHSCPYGGQDPSLKVI
ncbi:TBC1 domain family member 16 [Caerostris extrusa]|uniref:TBC1 domain family member 16 n=1 Tax=Caerostris extrusa TaxID=172846 RepID=A0AAV4YDN6_CAEEX|nr:TBC1 domain family member 16 [Caerostris extrusa]